MVLLRVRASGDVRRAAPVAAAVLAVATAAAPAFATCGAANCFLVTGTREGINDEGALTIDLSYRYIDQSRKRKGSGSTSEVLAPKIDFEGGGILRDHHREIRTQNTLVQLDLDYGLTDRVTIFSVLPLLNDRRHEHFDDAGTASERFTNGDGTAGFGDVRFGARGALAVRPKGIFVGGLTLKAPTGAYRLRDGEGDIDEPTIQPGTGAMALAASLYYAHLPSPGGGEWFASGSYQANQRNDLHYRIGNEAIVNAGFDRKLRGRATWSLQLNARWTRRDAFLGENVPSTGATLVNLTPGLRLSTATGVSFYLFAQAPVFEHVNEAQLGPRGGVVLGVSKLFE